MNRPTHLRAACLAASLFLLAGTPSVANADSEPSVTSTVANTSKWREVARPSDDESVPSMFFGPLSPEDAVRLGMVLHKSVPKSETAEYNVCKALDDAVDKSLFDAVCTSGKAESTKTPAKAQDALSMHDLFELSSQLGELGGGGFLMLLSEVFVSPDYGGDDGIAPTHAGYDYAPTIMWDGGKYRMWWCGDGNISGDRIWYAETTGSDPMKPLANWTTPSSVFTPTGSNSHFDGHLVCDPSVVKVGAVYFMYYGGYPNFNSPSWGETTRIGVALSYDGIAWSRMNFGNPIINTDDPIAPQTGFTTYGAGHPSVIYVDGYFHLLYDDTTGDVFGIYALRSPDPTFQFDVDEWRNGVWTRLGSGQKPSTGYPFLTTATNVDWAYSTALREFIVAIDGVGEVPPYPNAIVELGTHVSIRVFNKELTAETRDVVHIEGEWIDGPGLVTYSNGHILQNSACSTIYVHALRGGFDWAPPPPTTVQQCQNALESWVTHGTIPSADYAQFISCTELAHLGWNMATGTNGCRDWGTREYTLDDYDDDGISDHAIWRPSTQIWWTTRSSTANAGHGEEWGLSSTDKPIFRADYDGDLVTDPAFMHGNSFYILPSTGSCPGPFTPTPATKGCEYHFTSTTTNFPVVVDFDGDGLTDAAYYTQPGKWYAFYSGGGGGLHGSWGTNQDIPVPADYDGNGITDMAVYRATTGAWYIKYDNGSTQSLTSFGAAGDVPVPGGDWNDDGIPEPWSWRPSNKKWWYYDLTLGVADSWIPFGATGDHPMVADFDGDGKDGPVVWRPSYPPTWYKLWHNGTQPSPVQWGLPGDKTASICTLFPAAC